MYSREQQESFQPHLGAIFRANTRRAAKAPLRWLRIAAGQQDPASQGPGRQEAFTAGRSTPNVPRWDTCASAASSAPGRDLMSLLPRLRPAEAPGRRARRSEPATAPAPRTADSTWGEKAAAAAPRAPGVRPRPRGADRPRPFPSFRPSSAPRRCRQRPLGPSASARRRLGPLSSAPPFCQCPRRGAARIWADPGLPRAAPAAPGWSCGRPCVTPARPQHSAAHGWLIPGQRRAPRTNSHLRIFRFSFNGEEKVPLSLVFQVMPEWWTRYRPTGRKTHRLALGVIHFISIFYISNKSGSKNLSCSKELIGNSVHLAPHKGRTTLSPGPHPAPAARHTRNVHQVRCSSCSRPRPLVPTWFKVPL